MRIQISFFDPWIREGKNQDPGSELNIPDHIFESMGNKFLGLIYFNSFMRIRIFQEKNSDPGDKHPGSATLILAGLFTI
jgi:hypothetical protein